MGDCIFCKISSGEIPCLKVYEDDLTLAFMDIAKDVDGHILVVPKEHFKNVLDCDEETLCAVTKTVKTVSNHLTEQCGYEGGVICLMPAMRVPDRRSPIYIFT